MKSAFSTRILASFCFVSLCAAQTATTLPLIVKPDSLVFRQTGSTAPASQTINVSVKKGTLGALTVSTSGGSWLSASASGTAVTVSVATTSLASGKYSGSVSISASGFTSASVAVSLELSGNNVTVAPATISETVIAGGEVEPKTPTVNVYNLIGSAFAWTAATDQAWLTVSPSSGTGKTAMSVTVNPASMTAGNLTGHVTLTDTSNSTTATVTVNVTAKAAVPPNFQMGPFLNVPGVLTFVTENPSKAPAPKIFYGRNLGGGGALSFTLTGTVNSPTGGNWLSFSPSKNTTPGETTVTVNPTGLQPGDYSATISGTAKAPAGSTGGSLTSQAQVYLKVLPGPAITIDKKFLRFTSSTKVTPPQPSPASQTVTFATDSTTGYPFTAAATTAAGGSWLSVSPASGTATSGGTISVSVSPTVIAGLSPGFYTGDVTLTFGGNAPVKTRVIGVALRIYAPADPPQLQVSPGGLSFVAAQGGANPAAKSLKVRAESAGSTGLNYTVAAAVSSPSGGNWLSVGATSGTATSTAASIPVSVNTTGLTKGTYQGTITFTPDQTTNAQVLIVNVNLTIGPAGSTPTGNAESHSLLSHATPAAIAAGQMVATITDPPDNFTGSTDSGLFLAMTLNDANGNAVPGATVTVSSSNGEPDLTMEDLGTGIYTAVFQPAESGNVTLSVSAVATDSTGASYTSNVATVTGDIVSSGDVAEPVYTNGAVSAATYAPQPTPLTPGSIVALFGTNIAGSGGAATVTPLPTALGTTTASVTIGGVPAPLFGTYPASTPGGLDQINFQVPFELDGQATADIVVTTGGVAGAPQTVPIGTAPAVFTQNASGTGDGLIVHSDGITLVTPSNPATAGEEVVIYVTGLGDLQTDPPDGAGSSGLDSLAAATNMYVTIGGIPVSVIYSGLVPTQVGFYQLNVAVPTGLPSGENNVIVFVNGVPATGQATIALH